MSVPEWQRNAQLFAALVKTTSTIAVYVGDDGGRAVVQVGDGQLTVRYGTKYKPRPGDGVVLTFHGNTVRLTGPTASHSKLGTVQAVANPYLTVLCDGKPYSRMAYTVAYENESNPNGSLGPLVGDTVAIDWDGYYVTDRITTTPDQPAVPPLTTDQQPFDLTFYPTQSGSYKGSKWNSTKGDLLCDSSHVAGWFYGTKVQDALRDDAYVSSVEVYLSLRTKSGDQPKIGRHSDQSEQKTGLSSSDGTALGWKGWIALPTQWGIDWRTDTAGLTIGGGKSVYRGIGTDHQSGKLRIRGRQ